MLSMKLTVILSWIAIIPLAARADVSVSPESNWTWVGGSNLLDPTATGVPAARIGSTIMFANGALFVFAGTLIVQQGGGASSSTRNDLWKWNPTTRAWTLRKGTTSGSAIGNYNTLNSGNTATTPGSRFAHAMAYDSSRKLFYVFGGRGLSSSNPAYGRLNDLWTFSDTVNMWTWISGSSTAVDLFGVYGTRGVASSTNMPGSRWDHTLILVDDSLYLFGGSGYGISGSAGSLNDLWQWNMTSARWTWRSGGRIVDGVGSYGTVGQPSPFNVPAARSHHAMVFDAVSGMATMFGGDSSRGMLNDIWQLNGGSLIWTWFGGGANAVVSYGVKGIASPTNIPGPRSGHGMASVPNTGSIIVFGGRETILPDVLNDLWLWDPVTRYWTWISGANPYIELITFNYGTLGVTSSENMQRPREQHAMCTDSTGLVYVFSGTVEDSLLNDLWSLSLVDKKCPVGTALYGDSCLLPEVLNNLSPRSQSQTAPPTTVPQTSIQIVSTSAVVSSLIFSAAPSPSTAAPSNVLQSTSIPSSTAGVAQQSTPTLSSTAGVAQQSTPTLFSSTLGPPQQSTPTLSSTAVPSSPAQESTSTPFSTRSIFTPVQSGQSSASATTSSSSIVVPSSQTSSPSGIASASPPSQTTTSSSPNPPAQTPTPSSSPNPPTQTPTSSSPNPPPSSSPKAPSTPSPPTPSPSPNGERTGTLIQMTTSLPTWFLPAALSTMGLLVLLAVLLAVMWYRSWRIHQRLRCLDTELMALTGGTTTTTGAFKATMTNTTTTSATAPSVPSMRRGGGRRSSFYQPIATRRSVVSANQQP